MENPRFLRFHELPDFEIYSDQLVTIVNQQLQFLQQEVTPSMVNNYVKHKVIPLPHKKKYRKEHICKLLILSLLKTVFSMEEIRQYLTPFSSAEDYDEFCTVFEAYWHNTTNQQRNSNTISELFVRTVIAKYQAISLLNLKGEHHDTHASGKVK